MANKRSAMKAHRVSERRRLRNRDVRSALRTFVRKARVGIAAGVGAIEEAASAVLVATQHLDSAANKGVIHKNQAARRKSRLMRQLAAQQKAVESGAVVAEVTTTRKRATRATTGRAATPRATTPRTRRTPS